MRTIQEIAQQCYVIYNNCQHNTYILCIRIIGMRFSRSIITTLLWTIPKWEWYKDKILFKLSRECSILEYLPITLSFYRTFYSSIAKRYILPPLISQERIVPLREIIHTFA